MNELYSSLNQPDTLVADASLAWDMAYAAKPGREEIIARGRDLSINEAISIGTKIGEAMEVARQNHLTDVVGAKVVQQEVAAASVPETPSALVTCDHSRIEEMLWEKSFDMLTSTVSDIFATIRRRSDGSRAFGHEVPFVLGDEPGISERVTLYDPETGIQTDIAQKAYQTTQGLEPFDFEIAEKVPQENAKTRKELRQKNRTLQSDRTLILRNGEITLFLGNEKAEIKSIDSASFAAWTTRLTRSFPVSDPQCLSAGEAKSLSRREPPMNKQLRNKLDQDRRDYHALQVQVSD